MPGTDSVDNNNNEVLTNDNKRKSGEDGNSSTPKRTALEPPYIIEFKQKGIADITGTNGLCAAITVLSGLGVLQGGKAGMELVIANLNAIVEGKLNARDADHLKKDLAAFQGRVTFGTGVNQHDNKSIETIYTELESATKSTAYMLAGGNHAMSLIVHIDTTTGLKTFHFFDSNRQAAGDFSDIGSLKAKLNELYDFDYYKGVRDTVEQLKKFKKSDGPLTLEVKRLPEKRKYKNGNSIVEVDGNIIVKVSIKQGKLEYSFSHPKADHPINNKDGGGNTSYGDIENFTSALFKACGISDNPKLNNKNLLNCYKQPVKNGEHQFYFQKIDPETYKKIKVNGKDSKLNTLYKVSYVEKFLGTKKTALDPNRVYDIAIDVDLINAQDRYLDIEDNLLNKRNTDTNRQDFLKAKTNISGIDIPGYTADMSLEGMYKLADTLNDSANFKALGALSNHIDVAHSQQEARNKLHFEQQTDSVVNEQRRAIMATVASESNGIVSMRRLSQSAMLFANVDSDTSGRCYGITSAAAVALESGGIKALEQLFVNMDNTANNPLSKNAFLFKDSLASLQESAEKDYEARTDKQCTHTLDQIKQHLDDASQTTSFEFATRDHMMQVSVVVENGKKQYLFVDSNGIYFKSSTSNGLTASIAKYFTSLNDSKLPNYGVNAPANHEFEFKKQDTKTLGSLPIGDTLLRPADLSSTYRLSRLINERTLHQDAQVIDGNNEVIKPIVDAGIAHKDLYMAQAMLSGKEMARNLFNAFNKLYQDETLQLNNNWIPVFESIKETSTKGTYRISFVDPNNATSIKHIETTDDFLMKAKTDINKYIDQIKRNSSLGTDGKFRFNANIDNVHGTNTMNTAFGLQMLISLTQEHNRSEAAPNPLSKNLEIALKGHTYIAIAQTGQGVAEDFIQIATLFKQLKTAGTGLGTKIANVSGPLSVLLNGLSVGFSAYEYAHAENDTQKAVFGTQLAFDSIGLGLGTVSLASVFAPAGTALATVGAVASCLAVPIAGIGIGAAGLAQVYGEVWEDTKQVGDHFTEIEKAYQEGYTYDREKDILSLSRYSIIKEIDFNKGKITFDSQYLYPTGHLDLYGSRPDPDRANGRSTNVREAIQGAETKNITQGKDTSMIILPSTPKYYIKAHEQLIIGSGGENTRGHTLLRDIAKSSKGNFQYPGTNIIRAITQDYIHTTVDIKLCGRDRILITPDLRYIQSGGYTLNSVRYPIMKSNSMHYNMIGKGGKYTVALNEWASLNLATEGTKSSQWIFDTNSLDGDSIVIQPNKLTIGGIVVNIASNSKDGLVVIKKNGDICRIDPSTKKKILTQTNGWTGSVPAGYEMERYVAIKDYMHQGVNVGNAFYDASTQKVVFTTTNESHQSTELIETLKSLTKSPCFKVRKYIHGGYHTCSGGGGGGGGSARVESYRSSYELAEQNLKLITSLQNLISKWENGTYKSVVSGEDALYKKAKLWLENRLSFVNTLSQEVKSKSEYIWSEDKWGGWTSYNNKFDGGHIEFPVLLKDSVSLQQIKDLENGLQTLSWEAGHSGLLQNAQLGAVVGDDVYWYNTQEGLIWRTDKTTGDIKAQYVFDSSELLFKGGKDISFQYWSINNISFEQQNNKLLVSLDLQQIKNGCEHSKLIYHLDPDTIKLVSVHKSSGPKIEQLERKRFAFGATINTIKPQEAPLVSYYNEISANNYAFYWLRNGNEKIIPNLAKDQLNASLVLASSMKPANGTEVFYFFDPLKKELFRQEGLTSNLMATKIGDKKVLTTIEQTIGDHNLFILTENNVLKQVNSSGALTSVELNKLLLIGQIPLWLTIKFPLVKFVSVLKAGDEWNLVTDDGVRISLDSVGKATLIGLNQAWLDAKANNLSTSISSLIKDNNLSHGEVIALPDNTNGLRHWYHVDLKQTIEPSSNTKDKHPAYIGTEINSDGSKTVHIATSERHYLHHYDKDGKEIINGGGTNVRYRHKSYEAVHTQRFGETLTLVGSNGDDTLDPVLVQGVNSAVMSGGKGKDTYDLAEDPKKQLRHIIVNNFSTDREMDVLKLANTDKAILSRGANDNLNQSITKNDLLISQEGNLVVLKNVFAEDKADYNHMELHANNQKYNVAHLVSRIEQDARSGFQNTFYGLSSFDTLQ